MYKNVKSSTTSSTNMETAKDMTYTQPDKRRKEHASSNTGTFTNQEESKNFQANSTCSNSLLPVDFSHTSTDTEKLLLSAWDLPDTILNKYNEKGIFTLFDWQLECLGNENVMKGGNLLYSAPTSAGKTLVSEILMLKRVIKLGRKAIFVVPFVSLAKEKSETLQNLFGEAGILVECFAGQNVPSNGFASVDIAVCTIEKANSIVNSLLKNECLADLGTLVVDEIHMIGDSHRGYFLEILITKILYMNSTQRCSDGIQIIGMSATIPNVSSVAEWLNAHLCVTDFRPIPLKTHIKLGNQLYSMINDDLTLVRSVRTDKLQIDLKNDDMEDIIYLTLETVLDGFSVLIFCPSKTQVEAVATKIARQISMIGNSKNKDLQAIRQRIRKVLNSEGIRDFVDQICNSNDDCADVELKRAACFGVGYHHSGITHQAREMIENAFKKGILKVIVATTTLSAGVNLPARRVLISTPVFHRNKLDIATYKQMCGRAGRIGIDTEGESILICSQTSKDDGVAVFKGEMPIVTSVLFLTEGKKSPLKQAILEAIACGIVTTQSDLQLYIKCSYFNSSINTTSNADDGNRKYITQCIQYLEDNNFIRIKHFQQYGFDEDEYETKKLASASLSAAFAPEDALTVYNDLLNANNCVDTRHELRSLYQVVPLSVLQHLRAINWNNFLNMFGQLDNDEKEIADNIGITEMFIIDASIGNKSWANSAHRPRMEIHQRFYAALALRDWIKEKPIEQIASKFDLSKVIIKNLQHESFIFAGMLTAFCTKLKWKPLELLFSHIKERIEFGVESELCDLVRASGLDRKQASILYKSGITSITDFESTDRAVIDEILK